MNEIPAFTPLDAVTNGTTALAYLIVGLGAWLAIPRDARTRVFLGVALAILIGLGLPTVRWVAGIRGDAFLSRGTVGTMLCSLAIGSVLLFHFFQVFPWRRPWIARWWRMLPPLYVGTPLATAALVLLAPATPDDLTLINIGVMLAVALPLLVIVAITLPVAGIVSLVKSYREAAGGPHRAMRTPLLLTLISQVAGGTIAVLFSPVLTVMAPGSTAQAALKITAWLCGLLTPVGVALAVWRYGLPPIDSADAAAPAARGA